MEQYFREWRFADYSPMAVCGFYNPSLTLASMLDDTRSHDLFTRACFMLHQTSRDYPMSKMILQGLQALAWSLKQTIPPAALRCIASVNAPKEDLQDVPLGFIIPQHDEVLLLLAADDKESAQIGAQLGALITKWSRQSIE